MCIILVNCLGMFELTEKLAPEVKLSSPVSDPSVFVSLSSKALCLKMGCLPDSVTGREGINRQPKNKSIISLRTARWKTNCWEIQQKLPPCIP